MALLLYTLQLKVHDYPFPLPNIMSCQFAVSTYGLLAEYYIYLIKQARHRYLREA